MLIQLTLEKICNMLQDYFDKFKMKVTIRHKTTNWQTLELQFLSYFLNEPETSTRGPTMAKGVKQPPTQAFMDDLTSTAKT